jgi:hypothetical protein
MGRGGDAGVGTQRPALRLNEPKKTCERSAIGALSAAETR